MKRNVQRALAISGIAITVGATGIVYDVSAKNDPTYGIQGSQREKMTRFKKTGCFNNFAKQQISVVGTVISKTDDSLAIKRGNKEYSIKVSDDARILDQKWQPINISGINNGDKIRVSGEISDSLITAKMIRDISLK